jgi:hypothetical protein
MHTDIKQRKDIHITFYSSALIFKKNFDEINSLSVYVHLETMILLIKKITTLILNKNSLKSKFI